MERADQGLEQGEKKVQIAIEQDGGIRRILDKAAASRHADLEAREAALRAAVLSAGATQEILRFEQAYINLHLNPRSKIRKGAPMATMIGPQRIGTFERFRV